MRNLQGTTAERDSALVASRALVCPSTHTWLDLVRRLYRATEGEASWQEFADRLSAALDGAVVALSLRVPGDRRIRHLHFAGACADAAGSRADALVAAASESPEALARFSSGFVSAADASGAPNLVHLTAVADGRADSAVLAFRAPGEPDFGPAERALVERLVPHLGRCYAISKKFLGMAKQSTALVEVMNRLPAGILLLDDAGRVVHRNRSARRILQRRDGLQLVDGRITAQDPEADEWLQALILDVISATAAPDAGGIAIAHRALNQPAYPVSVSRLLPAETLHDIVACVLVSDPDHGLAPALELMRNLHDLTPSEAALIGQLAEGRTIEESARSRGVSVNTMRSHLKHVFHKTGTNRQGELVQLVLRSFVPVIGE